MQNTFQQEPLPRISCADQLIRQNLRDTLRYATPRKTSGDVISALKKRTRMRQSHCALIFAVAMSGPAAAQEFPEGSAPLTQESLSTAVAGKVFSVKTAQGPVWRWQFKADGYFFINIGGFSDSGKWTVKESTLCTEGSKINYSCNEVRSTGGELVLRRDNGEIVKLVVQ